MAIAGSARGKDFAKVCALLIGVVSGDSMHVLNSVREIYLHVAAQHLEFKQLIIGVNFGGLLSEGPLPIGTPRKKVIVISARSFGGREDVNFSFIQLPQFRRWPDQLKDFLRLPVFHLLVEIGHRRNVFQGETIFVRKAVAVFRPPDKVARRELDFFAGRKRLIMNRHNILAWAGKEQNGHARQSQ